MKKISSFLVLIVCSFLSLAQSPPSAPPPSTSLSAMVNSIVNNKIYFFNFDYQKPHDSFFIDYKSSFGLGANDSFKILRTYTDDLGYNHTLFIQLHKGIEVKNTDINLRTKAGTESFMSGTVLSVSGINLTGLIPESQALSIATNLYPQNIAYNTSLYPFSEGITSKKIIVKFDNTYKLCYMVSLDVVVQDIKRMDIYIDATTGDVLDRKNIAKSNSSGCTIHYGKQNIRTLDSTHLYHFGCRPAGHNYTNRRILLDTSRPFKFMTNYFLSKSDTARDANNIIQQTDLLQRYVYNYPQNQKDTIGCINPNDLVLRSGVEAHWLVDKFIDMVQLKYKYNFDTSVLNSGFICNHDPDQTNPNKRYFNVLVTDNDLLVNNALYTGSTIMFGRRMQEYFLEKNDPPVFMIDADIVGHELGHFALRNLRGIGFEYENETGAIDEGLADVVGTLFERYLTQQSFINKPSNWLTPDDLNGIPGYNYNNGTPNFPYTRNIKDPLDRNHPSYSGSPFWNVPSKTCCTADFVNGSNDYCWVHLNSSIVAKWFQLLVDGGSNRNAPYQYQVSPIPIDSIGKLIFYTIKNSITSNVTFSDLYTLTLSNIYVIFPVGVRANYDSSIRKAWWSVGIGNPPRTRPLYVIPANKTLFEVNYIRDYTTGTPPMNRVDASNKDFVLMGNFTINRGMKFNCKNCNFYVKNNGKITIEENAEVLFDTCYFTAKDTTRGFSCSSTQHPTWQGIATVPNGISCIENNAVNPKLTIKNSIIENAQRAITSGSQYICDHQPSMPTPQNGYGNQYGGIIEVDKVKFVNNGIDIWYARSDFREYNLTVNNSQFLYLDTQVINKTACILLRQRFNPSLRELMNAEKNLSAGTINDQPILIKNSIFSTPHQVGTIYSKVNAIEYDFLKTNSAIESGLIRIDSCNFRGFRYAVKGIGAAHIGCRHNTIKNSETGISLSQTTQAEVVNNLFMRTNYSVDVRHSIVSESPTRSVYSQIDSNKFYFIYNAGSVYANKKEIYLSNTQNAEVEHNLVYSMQPTGDLTVAPYVAFHIVGTTNTRVKYNYFSKENCWGIDANQIQDNNCIGSQHIVPIVWERHDNNAGFFVKNTISDWWTRGIHTRYHNRNVRIKCNDLFPTKAPDHTAIFIDSGEFRNQGINTSNHLLSCNSNAGTLPAANRFLYRANGLAVNDNCTYPTHYQQPLQGINPSSKQIAIRPHNLPSGYVWRYYTQQKDGNNIETPRTECYTISSYINVNNCKPGDPAYTILPTTCDESNLYQLREPEGGLGSGTPCEQISIWKDHRLDLFNQLQSEPVICGEDATQHRFEILHSRFQLYLDILDADDNMMYQVDTCNQFSQYEAEIINSPIVASQYSLAERYIQRGQLSSAATLINQIKTAEPFERSIFCDKRLEHFNAEHTKYGYILDLELRQAQRKANGDTTGLSTSEINHLISYRDSSLGKAAVKAEKLIEEYTGDKLYRRIPGYQVQTTNTPVLVDSGELLPLTIFPNPNNGQFELAFEYPHPYSQAQIYMYKLTQPTQPVFSRTLTAYPRYIQESIQLNQVNEGLYSIILYINNQATAGATVQISY